MSAPGGYYVPHEGKWPIVGSVGLFLLVGGFANALPTHNADGSFGGPGIYVMFLGLAILITMMFGWFGDVIRESESDTYNEQVDRSFRWGMAWFIFSEVMFFAAFFVPYFTRGNFLCHGWVEKATTR